MAVGAFEFGNSCRTLSHPSRLLEINAEISSVFNHISKETCFTGPSLWMGLAHMRSGFRGLFLSVLAAPLLVSACASVREPELKSAPLTTSTVYSGTSSMRETIVTTPGQQVYICAQPMPDAAFDFGENGGFALNLVNIGSGAEAGSEGEESQEQELSGRTPGVLQTRELLYRLCEFSRNHDLSTDVALQLYERNLQIIEKIATNESKNTKVAIGDTVSSQALSEAMVSGAAAALSSQASSKHRSDDDADDTYDDDYEDNDNDADDSDDEDDDGDNDSSSSSDPVDPFANVQMKD